MSGYKLSDDDLKTLTAPLPGRDLAEQQKRVLVERAEAIVARARATAEEAHRRAVGDRRIVEREIAVEVARRRVAEKRLAEQQAVIERVIGELTEAHEAGFYLRRPDNNGVTGTGRSLDFYVIRPLRAAADKGGAA